MQKPERSICLYLENVSDIQRTIDMGKKATYSRIIVRVSNPHIGQRENGKYGDKRDSFTRSELLLSATQWRRNTILKISEFNDCDSPNCAVLKQSNQNLKQEIDWAKHLDEMSCIIVKLNNDQVTHLGRQLLMKFDRSGCVMAEIPLVDEEFFRQDYIRSRETIELSTASANVWHRWSKFQFSVGHNNHFKVALELTPILPSECDVNRWCGEPVEMIIIPSDLFNQSNNNNQIGLEDTIRDICLQFLNKTEAHFAVKCRQDDPWMSDYAHCLRKILLGSCQRSQAYHVCNDIFKPGLKFSLKDTTNNCTKYQQKMFGVYEQAIRLAIADRLQSEDKVRLMICGASGWKLLHTVMHMVDDTEAIYVFIYEEDTHTQTLIYDAIEWLYADKKITIIGDAKEYYNQMDIVVSITMEAIYESQWLQFNFDNVRNYIRSDAILIPNQSTLSIVPVTSTPVYSYLQEGNMKFTQNRPPNAFIHYETRTQIIYPLYTRNLYECAAAQEVFKFRYPTRSVHISNDTRLRKLHFNIDRDCVVTGFCGYFKATFYKDITLNNRTWFKNHNTNCIPMVYFPLKSAQILNAQDILKAVFYLIGDGERKKYWYEWQTIAPHAIGNQNLNGEICAFQHPNTL